MVILVVDDDEDARSATSAILGDAGYKTLQAGNGRAALEIVQLHKVDVIVTDLVMPDTEGIELIMNVRKLHPDIEIIAVSGSLQAQTYLRSASLLGAKFTFEKPFPPRHLLSALKTLGEKTRTHPKS